MDTKRLKTLVSKIDSINFISKVRSYFHDNALQTELSDDVILLYLELLILANLSDVTFSEDNVNDIVALRNSFMLEYEKRISSIAYVGNEEKAKVLALHVVELSNELSSFLEYEIAIAPHRYGDYERLPFRNSRTLPATEKRECLAPFLPVDTIY